MKALILAAGKGQRLGSPLPKPLNLFLGKPIIDRAIENLKKAGIDEIYVVYSNEKVKEHLDGRVNLVFNDDVERELGYSLLLGAKAIGDEFILVMADHIFDHTIVKKLIEEKPDVTTLCVDFDIKNKNLDESTKVLVVDGYINDIGKNIDNFNAIDTGIFFCTREVLDVAEKLEKFAGRFTVTDVMKELIKRKRFKALDVTGHFWYDLDTREEFKKAEEEFLKLIIKDEDGIIAKNINRKLSVRLSKILAKTSITPNTISFLSFLIALGSGLFFARGLSFLGGVLAQISSIIDGCDGEIARIKGLSSKFGGFFDAVLDRYADFFIIAGMMASSPERLWMPGVLAILGSYSISYTSSKAKELAGISWLSTATKFAKRDMRLFIIFIGGMLNLIFPTLVVLAVLTNAVVALRVLQFRKLSREK